MRTAPQRPVMHTREQPPPGPVAHRPRRSALRRRLHQAELTLLVLLDVMLTVATPSVVTALTAPGTQSTTARLAEWGRNHGLSPVVTGLEQLTYQSPQVGGMPGASSPLRQPLPAAMAPSGPSTLPPPVTPVASPALAGEGQWQTIAAVHGQPAMAKTFLRPDATHTSYTAGAVWFDPHLLRATLHPGTAQPVDTAGESPLRSPSPADCWPRSTRDSSWPTHTAGSMRTGVTRRRWPPVARRWCSTPMAR